MTSIFNDPEAFREDMTAGFVAAYGRYVEAVPGASGVMRVGGARAGKVSLIIGGGSGHYPAFCGTVGPGVADGAVMGDVFTSPSTEQAYRVAKALDGGAGVLFSYGNYAGDVLNFDAAQVRLRDEGIDCRTVLCTDDVSSASADEREKRRGVAGDLCVFKIAGAAADGGASLDEVEALAQRTNEVTRTFGVAFAGCTLPGQSEPLFTVEPGKIELGMGIHGEPGVRTADSVGAAELATMLVEPLLEERPEGADGRAAVLLNGLGATKYEELFVLYKDVVAALEGAGVKPVMPEVGELVTSLDMAGCSLTICWLDDELEALWKAPADTPAFRRGEVSSLPDFERATADDAAGEPVQRERADASPEAQEAATIARGALERMLAAIAEREDELGRLDAVAGDGDHGTGMVRGFRAAVAAADAAGPVGAGTLLQDAGAAFGDKAGGTSGSLWGEMLRAAGASLGDEGHPGAAQVAAAVKAAADTAQRVGKASVGDKTLLDALVPFSEKLSEGVDGHTGLIDAWGAAVQVAEERAQATAELVPKVGRARPLGERSKGTPDPGAVSMAAALAAAQGSLQNKMNGE